MTGEEGEIVFGFHPALAILADGTRPVESVHLLIGGRGDRFAEAETLARARGVRPRLLERAALDRLTGSGAHQGIAVRVGVRVQPTWDTLLERLEERIAPVLLVLDCIEDPRNLGAILRSAEAFGAEAVILPRDRSAPLSPVAVKASAGAAGRLDAVRVINLARALTELRERGVRVVGLAGDASRNLETGSLAGPLALVLGGEGKGLRRLTRERCDEILAIPMRGAVGSLNVAVAAGIALYETRRGRDGQS
ncbi:MAG: 23S rRNA (guanosine(2251)-2'-O)-methyltransferase RlmB [Magnetococcales bacterium]|nr:23S rRNA (guanosine(2251)-2'-O)-methyltransferase RlmB [Magnetococcales bacterium]